MPRPRRSAVLLLLAIYVVPLTLVTVFLVHVGLGILAVALVCIEAVVALSVYAARQPVPAARREPSERPWLVPVAMIGSLLAMAAATAVWAAVR